MRFGVIADVHANLHALDAALAFLADQDVEAYLCAGDLVGYGPFPNECVRRVRDLPGRLRRRQSRPDRPRPPQRRALRAAGPGRASAGPARVLDADDTRVPRRAPARRERGRGRACAMAPSPTPGVRADRRASRGVPERHPARGPGRRRPDPGAHASPDGLRRAQRVAAARIDGLASAFLPGEAIVLNPGAVGQSRAPRCPSPRRGPRHDGAGGDLPCHPLRRRRLSPRPAGPRPAAAVLSTCPGRAGTMSPPRCEARVRRLADAAASPVMSGSGGRAPGGPRA